MTLHLRKCIFLSSQVTFLGFTVSSNGLSKDPEYVRMVEAIKLPHTTKEL